MPTTPNQGTNSVAAYRLAGWMSRTLPRRLGYWTGLRIADLFYLRDARGRAAVAENLGRIFRHQRIQPSRTMIRGLARKTYQHFGQYLVDFFRFSRAQESLLKKMVSIQRIENLSEPYRDGRGVILATAHLGNWEIGALVLAAHGYKVTAVYRPFGIPHLDRLFAEQRENRGVRLVPLGASVRPLIHALRRGEAVALLADRDFSGRARPRTFFGAPARLPDGAARLAWNTGAPIVPTFLTRNVDDTFLMSIGPAIRPERFSGAEAIQQSLIGALETAIAAAPSQWFVFEPFWDAEPEKNPPC